MCVCVCGGEDSPEQEGGEALEVIVCVCVGGGGVCYNRVLLPYLLDLRRPSKYTTLGHFAHNYSTI